MARPRARRAGGSVRVKGVFCIGSCYFGIATDVMTWMTPLLWRTSAIAMAVVAPRSSRSASASPSLTIQRGAPFTVVSAAFPPPALTLSASAAVSRLPATT